MLTRLLLSVSLLLLTLHSTAGAWGAKEHIQITRLAARQLIDDPQTPPAMRSWLCQSTGGGGTLAAERQYFLTTRVGPIPRGVDGLAFWAVVPDLAEDRWVAPYGVAERMLHFLDLEYFTDDLPRDPADGRYTQAGLLPFRVEDCYQRLGKHLREGQLTDQPGQYPRDQHAVRWAGFLAHYVADSTQPHHSTVDYKSRSYVANPKFDVHQELEYKLGDDETDDRPELRLEYWAALERALASEHDPAPDDNVWQATITTLRLSHESLPLIGEAVKAAAGETFDTAVFYRYKGAFAGKQMSVIELKARQQAWAVKRIARLWRQAWDEAQTKR